MKVKFNFNISAWITDVEIEANSVEEAEKKLLKKDVSDLISLGYIQDSDLDDIGHEVVSRNITVKASNITYNLSNWDFEYLGIDSEEDRKAYIETLPKELEVSLYDIENDDDLEEKISDEIFDKTDTFVDDFDYEIIREE